MNKSNINIFMLYFIWPLNRSMFCDDSVPLSVQADIRQAQARNHHTSHVTRHTAARHWLLGICPFIYPFIYPLTGKRAPRTAPPTYWIIFVECLRLFLVYAYLSVPASMAQWLDHRLMGW